jgi:ketosteroid isomerase-like protein
MSAENVEIVRSLHDAFVRGDYGAVFSVIDPEIEFSTPPQAPDFRTYRGHKEMRRAFTSWIGTWESQRYEFREYIDAGERVLAAYRQWGKLKGTDAEVDAEVFDVYTLRAGKVIRYEMFFERNPALAAAGLSSDAHTSS